jgi:hypothetical protein
MADEILTVTPASTTPDASTNPADVVASAAKEVTESTPKADESTLLGKKADEVVTPAPAAVAVPDKYEIKAPEGMTIDPVTLEAVTPVFKELGLSQEGAQKLVDAYAPQVSAMLQKQQDEAIQTYQSIKDEWKAETVKELGVNGDKELALAAKAINQFGDDSLRKMLDDTGLGNNIHAVKFFIKVGKAFSSDSFPDPASQKGHALTEDEKAKSLFPTSEK